MAAQKYVGDVVNWLWYIDQGTGDLQTREQVNWLSIQK